MLVLQEMPASSPVYQPTTVTYESTSPPERWTSGGGRPGSGGGGYLPSVSVTRGGLSWPCGGGWPRRCLPHALLALALLVLAAGLVMVVEGALRYGGTRPSVARTGPDGQVEEVPSSGGAAAAHLALAIAGAVFLVVSLVILGE